MNSNSVKLLLVSIIIFGLLFILGCSDKDQTAKEEQPNTAIKKEVIQEIPVEKPVVKKEIVPELMGAWIGKFDSRDATLSIVEQNGTIFKGLITVNYRSVSKQEVEGTIDTVTNSVSMKDMLHSRAKGVYSAKLSEDSKSMEGVFTMNLDGKKLKFNLNKK